MLFFNLENAQVTYIDKPETLFRMHNIKIKTIMMTMVMITMIMMIQIAVAGNKSTILIHKQTRSQ